MRLLRRSVQRGLALAMMLGIGLVADASSATLRERLSGFQAGAHRGGIFHAWASGNTLSNFERARAEGVDIIEMDLRPSRDGTVFVFHDRTLDKLTNCRGTIEASLAREVAGRCSYKWTHDPIPTFREVLEWAATQSSRRGHLVLNAEFKDEEVIDSALALAKAFDAYDWVYFQADSRSKYEHARRVDGKVALLYKPRAPTDVSWALGLGDPNLLVLEVHEDNGTKASIPRIHAAGKLVSENSFRRGSELGVARCDDVFRDGIDIAISNRTSSCAHQRDRSEHEGRALSARRAGIGLTASGAE